MYIKDLDGAYHSFDHVAKFFVSEPTKKKKPFANVWMVLKDQDEVRIAGNFKTSSEARMWLVMFLERLGESITGQGEENDY